MKSPSGISPFCCELCEATGETTVTNRTKVVALSRSWFLLKYRGSHMIWGLQTLEGFQKLGFFLACCLAPLPPLGVLFYSQSQSRLISMPTFYWRKGEKEQSRFFLQSCWLLKSHSHTAESETGTSSLSYGLSCAQLKLMAGCN